MRGRTNIISSGGEAVANGELKEFVVAEGESIGKGDFVSTKNNATKNIESTIGSCLFRGGYGLNECDIFILGKFNEKTLVAAKPNGTDGYVLYIFGESDDKIKLLDMIKLEDFGGNSIENIKSGNIFLLGEYIFCTQYNSKKVGSYIYNYPCYSLYKIIESGTSISLNPPTEGVFKAEGVEEFLVYSSDLSYFVQKINENYLALYIVYGESGTRDWDGIHLYKLENGELVHKSFFNTEKSLYNNSLISSCCYNGEDIVYISGGGTFVFHFDSEAETISEKNVFNVGVGVQPKCNVFYNDYIYFLSNSSIVKMKADGSSYPSAFPITEQDTRGVFSSEGILYRLCLLKGKDTGAYDVGYIKYSANTVSEDEESPILFRSGSYVSANILCIQNAENLFFLYIQGNTSQNANGELTSIEGKMSKNEIVIGPDNVVYKYDGSNKSIGFSKMGGTEGETIKVYVPKV